MLEELEGRAAAARLAGQQRPEEVQYRVQVWSQAGVPAPHQERGEVERLGHGLDRLLAGRNLRPAQPRGLLKSGERGWAASLVGGGEPCIAASASPLCVAVLPTPGSFVAAKVRSFFAAAALFGAILIPPPPFACALPPTLSLVPTAAAPPLTPANQARASWSRGMRLKESREWVPARAPSWRRARRFRGWQRARRR